MSGGSRSASEAPGRVVAAIGWWVLIVLMAGLLVGHVVGIFWDSPSDEEQAIFVSFAALQGMSVVVLIVPYRRFERWAWWVSWIPIAALAAAGLILLDRLGGVYLGVSAILALAQLATVPRFMYRRGQSESAP